MRRRLSISLLLMLVTIAPAVAQTTNELWSNNGSSSLASAINSSTTSIVVASGQGSRFPSPSGSQYFWVTLQSGATVEIVKCTARSTDTLTCTRGQQSTTAASFSAGARVENRLTSQTLSDIKSAIGPPMTLTLDSAQTTTLVSQTTGGVDEALDTAYECFRFTMSGTTLGSITVRLKRDSGTTAGNVRMFLYTDSSGPSTDVSDTSTGMPSIVYASATAGGITTSYADYGFRINKTGLTSGANYWACLNTQSVAGGSIYLERRSSGTSIYATDADGVAPFTTASSKEPYYLVRDTAGDALSVTDLNQHAVRGTTTTGFGGYFEALGAGAGVKANAIHNFGVGGFSTFGIGVRGSSVDNFAGAFVSTNSAGLSAQTLADGVTAAQFASTTGPAFQAATSAGGAAIQYLPLQASAGSAGWLEAYAAEEITLGGTTTTDSTADLIPAGSIIEAVVWRVTQTISGGTATAFMVGTPADQDVFEGATSALTSGTTGYGLNFGATFAGPFGHTSATKVRITTDGTTTAGKIRVVVFYKAFTPPAS